jgi:hypothetical protein
VGDELAGPFRDARRILAAPTCVFPRGVTPSVALANPRDPSEPSVVAQVYQAHDAAGVYTNRGLQRMKSDSKAHQFGNAPKEYAGDHYYERLKAMHRQRLGPAEQLASEKQVRSPFPPAHTHCLA